MGLDVKINTDIRNRIIFIRHRCLAFLYLRSSEKEEENNQNINPRKPLRISDINPNFRFLPDYHHFFDQTKP
jgi:hypothetical protein